MLHFIVNPNAKFASKVLPALEGRLKQEGVSYEILSGANREETRNIVRTLTEAGEKRIVAVGGDGTLSDVLNGISDPEGVELGLIPAGTGNDFATAANIPLGEKALDLILHTEPKFTDYIECGGGMRSMNIAGLGIDVDILERCYRMKHGGAKSKYFRGLLASLVKYKGQRVEVTADGESFSVTAFIAAVCNGTHLGGGIPLCPPAELGDGKLDLVVIESPKRRKLPYYLLRLMKGRVIGLPIVKHILCECASIEQVDGKMIQLDGELVESKKLETHIVSRKLKMFRG